MQRPQNRKEAVDQFRAMWRELRWIGGCVRRYRSQVAAYLFMGLLCVGMGLGSSVASKYLIDAVTGADAARLPTAAALMAGLMLGNVGIKLLYRRLGATVFVRVRREMRAGLFDKILCADWERLGDFRSGDLLNRLSTDAAQVAEAAVSLLPDFVLSFLQFAGALVIVLVYDPVMALIVFVSVPLSALLSRMLVRRMRQHSRRMRQLDSDILSYNEDTLGNLQTVKAFAVGDRFSDRMLNLQQQADDAYLSYNRFSLLTSLLMSVIGLLSYACCFGWSVWRLWTGTITYGTMTLFLQMANSVSGSFTGLIRTVPTAVSACTAAGRLMEVLEVPNEPLTAAPYCGGAVNLHMERITFAYRQSPPTLQEVSLDIRAGETVAIVGPSGKGKTTLLRVLLELVTPTAGRVWLEPCDPKTPPPAAIRTACAYVPQGNTLFAGTIAENLRITAPDATEPQMVAALKAAAAWEFVQALPQGLDTPVGEHGTGFSEGQAQRLAIARALLKQAPILLLDEATAALDAETEQQVLKSLSATGADRATLVITHRPGVLELCDRVYRLENGSLTPAFAKEAIE